MSVLQWELKEAECALRNQVFLEDLQFEGRAHDDLSFLGRDALLLVVVNKFLQNSQALRHFDVVRHED